MTTRKISDSSTSTFDQRAIKTLSAGVIDFAGRIAELEGEVIRLRAAAILAARSSPEDIRRAGWVDSRRTEDETNGRVFIVWCFWRREHSARIGYGPTDADALDSIRRQLGLSILGETPLCRQCGGPCEEARWVYATPTCFRCLPPPEPLPVRPFPDPKSTKETR